MAEAGCKFKYFDINLVAQTLINNVVSHQTHNEMLIGNGNFNCILDDFIVKHTMSIIPLKIVYQKKDGYIVTITAEKNSE